MGRLVCTLCIVFLIATGCREEKHPAQTDWAFVLLKLEDRVRQRNLDSEIFLRIKHGLPIYQLPDISRGHAEDEVRFAETVLAELKQIPLENLGDAQRNTREILHWWAQITIDGLPFHGLPFLGIPYSLPDMASVHQAFGIHKFETSADRDRYLDLIDQYAALIQALLDRFKRQAGQGVVMPAAQIDLAAPLFTSYRAEPENSQFWVSDQRLASLDAVVTQTFYEQLRRAIREKVNVNLEAMTSYLQGPYREQAPDQVGLGQYPGGAAFYRYLIRAHTTLDLNPEEIHEKGLQAVADLHKKIDAIKESVGFEGDRAEFFAMLKANPRFYATTPEEVGERLMSYIKKIEPVLDRFFVRKPEAPYGVARLPASLEGSMTFGYYQWPTVDTPMGTYYFNGSKLDERSLLNAESLIYHELAPGHHFQVASQLESKTLSNYRKESFHTAYAEGWADYAADLGLEMGGYQDPYDLLGLYMMDMFISVRLVVDTGMNALGWTRARAMAYMSENLMNSETQIQTETLRYSVAYPAQALAYKIGSEKIHELRGKAEAALGDQFDIRRFHAAVLEPGSLPLTVLEKHIDRFVERETKTSDDAR